MWGHLHIMDKDTESWGGEKELGCGFVARVCQGWTRGQSLTFSRRSFLGTFASPSLTHGAAASAACAHIRNADLGPDPGSSESEPAF